MTIVCFKDGILAADSVVVEDGMAYGLMRKIIRSDTGCLAGGSGDVSSLYPFLEWVRKGMKARGKPTIGELDGIVIKPNGEILFFENGLVPFKVSSKSHAIGSGAQMAIGAMMHGATAIQAVKYVCERITTCQEPIQALRLDGATHELDPKRLGID
jgi:hypothetical protein